MLGNTRRTEQRKYEENMLPRTHSATNTYPAVTLWKGVMGRFCMSPKNRAAPQMAPNAAPRRSLATGNWTVVWNRNRRATPGSMCSPIFPKVEWGVFFCFVPPRSSMSGCLVQSSWVTAMRRARRSLGWFIAGLLLAFILGLTALYVQNQALWYCLALTVSVAACTSFGMALSARVRCNVMLTLPMFCSREGKRVVLFLTLTLLIQGPFTNTLANVERAAGSVVCGAELTRNQTQQLLQRAASPLLPVLDKIKDVGRRAHSLAGRVQNFIQALAHTVRHTARSLRNVLHFLASIGDICNDKLGTPYKKCNAVFDEGRASCMALLSVFSFLCRIADGFRPLCGLTRVGEFFCIIPSYIGNHLKAELALPTIAAFERMRKEFEFNMSASVHFNMSLDSSQSVRDTTQKILEEVTEARRHFHQLTALLTYVGLFVLLLMYLQAVLYKHRYLHVDDFENFYITEQFVELDRKFSRQGRPAVLPLNDKEARTYIIPCSVRLTARERRAMAAGLVSLLRHVAMGGVVMALDLMVFWVFDILHHQAQGEIVARAPVVIDVEVNGSGYAADIYKDIVASFDILQRGNITVLSRKCLMKPLEPEYTAYLIIGLLYGLSCFLVLAGHYARRLQRFVCSRYHPQREQERVLWLRGRILSHRRCVGRAVLRALARAREDEGHTGSTLYTLALRLPGGATIARLLGVCEKCCLACGQVIKSKDSPDVFICPTPHCTGCFCMKCFRVMGSVCAGCAGPPGQNSEQEIDSSDEELVNLQETPMTSPHFSQRSDGRKVMRKRRRRCVSVGRPVRVGRSRSVETEESSGSDLSDRSNQDP